MSDWSRTDSDPIFTRPRWLEDSSTFQEIIQEGREKGRKEGASIVRQVVLEVGRQRFGEPSLPIRTELEGIWSLSLLQQLAYRLSESESWEELLTVDYGWRPSQFHEMQGYQKSILRIGSQRFGEPTEANRRQLQYIRTIEKLEAVVNRVANAASWDELLAETEP